MAPGRIPAQQYAALLDMGTAFGAPSQLFRPPQRLGSRLVAGCSERKIEDDIYENLQSLETEMIDSITLSASLDKWISFLLIMIVLGVLGLSRKVCVAFREAKRK